MSADSVDYIVIGAGHNGLTAGCTLAEAGASVVVLEQLDRAGGLSTSAPYLPQAPEHIMSLGAMDDVFMAATSLPAQLGLAGYGYSAARLEHPYGWIGEDGETLLLFHDAERTIREIAYFSPRDARAYGELRTALDWLLDTQQLVTTRHPASLPRRQLLRQLLRLAPSRSTRRAIARMFSTTLVEMIVDTFESDPLRALCTYWGSMIGPIDADGTGFFCVSLAAVHREPGVMRPLGGMGALVRALEACLQDRGGSVRTQSRVVRILVEGGRATGVLLDDDTKLTARRGVLASCAPQVALGRLLEAGTLDSATEAKVAVLPANANGSATLKVDLALSGRASYPTAQARRDRRDRADLRRTSLMTGTFEAQLRQLREVKRGGSLACAPVYMSILSSNDASIAPAGQDVVYLASNMPVAPAGGWEVEKDRYAEIVLSSAGRFMGGLEQEIGRVVSTPADFEERCSTPRGAYFHVDMGSLRVGMNRPARGLGGYATPVSGLYLAGAGSHPGGGVSGWPGRLAAQAALRANGTSTIPRR